MTEKNATVEDVYAFKYVRAGDMQEIEQGPFLTMDEAKEGKEMMESMGAICSEVYPYAGDPEKVVVLKAEKNSYVAGKVKKFEVYLQRELAVLEGGVGYKIVYKYIDELQKRVTRFIKEDVPRILDEKDGWLEEKIKEFAAHRKEYLKRVAKILDDKSDDYSPLDGSVPEDIRKTLKNLSGFVGSMK